ncbi:MAG: hypothetical protein QW756_06025 [Nitrososphaerota archaeon]
MTVERHALSYIVGALLILAITVSAVALYSSTTSFQSQVIFSLSILDVKRVSESLVIVEYHRPSDTLVIYNDGVVSTCFVELALVGGPIFYSNPSCTPIQPGQFATITAGLVSPPQKFTIIARTIHNKIVTYTIS